MRPTLLQTSLALSVALLATACAQSAPPSDSAASASAAPPATAAAPELPPVAPADAPAAAAAATAAPSASASTAAAASATASATASSSSSSATAPAGPAPAVKVANIGMHIGGGPNDAPTKAPIGNSVSPHFPEMARCFAKVADPKKGGDFGVDLKVPAAGGKAEISHPRTTLKGEGFSPCVLAVFEAVDFQKPKGGVTVVSYSLRFTPEK